MRTKDRKRDTTPMERRAYATAETLVDFSGAPRMRPGQIDGLAQMLTLFAEHEIRIAVQQRGASWRSIVSQGTPPRPSRRSK